MNRQAVANPLATRAGAALGVGDAAAERVALERGEGTVRTGGRGTARTRRIDE